MSLCVTPFFSILIQPSMTNETEKNKKTLTTPGNATQWMVFLWSNSWWRCHKCPQQYDHWQNIGTTVRDVRKLFFIERYRNVSNMAIMSYLILISSSWFGTDNITLYLATCEGYVSFYKYSYLQGWLCIAQGAVIHQCYNPTENIGKQLRTSENISRTSKKHLISFWEQLRTHQIKFSSVWRGFQQSDQKVGRWRVISDQTNS